MTTTQMTKTAAIELPLSFWKELVGQVLLGKVRTEDLPPKISFTVNCMIDALELFAPQN